MLPLGDSWWRLLEFRDVVTRQVLRGDLVYFVLVRTAVELKQRLVFFDRDITGTVWAAAKRGSTSVVQSTSVARSLICFISRRL